MCDNIVIKVEKGNGAKIKDIENMLQQNNASLLAQLVQTIGGTYTTPLIT